MYKLRISGPGTDRIEQVDKPSIFIGRGQENDLVLPVTSVSKRHARLVIKEGRLVFIDLNSTNGSFINGVQISSPTVVKTGEVITLGEFNLVLMEMGSPAQTPPQPPPLSTLNTPKQPPTTMSGARIPAPQNQKILAIKREIQEQLIGAMDLRRLDINKLGEDELYNKTRKIVAELISKYEESGEIPAGIDKNGLAKDVLDEALGLGPIEEYLADGNITEVMVNGPSQIYIERDGKLLLTDKQYSSDTAVYNVIERIIAPLGRRIDESSPLVDARLKDGSRVNAIIPPLSIKGPAITIRKFRQDKLTWQDLVNSGTWNNDMVEFLKECVRYRRNILISGGTGSGKTTTLNALSEFISNDERIVTVEDAAELRLKQDHWLALESRPPNIEGKGQITIRDLVRNCLRMRPDRIIVGECRSGEALDMLQAMNTGHDGSLTTVHANAPRDALSRVETMVLMAGMDLPIKAIREQISSAINIIIHQSRMPDGSRKVTYISEITGMEGDIISMQDIFSFKQSGYDEGGRVVGKFAATGFIPKFYDDIQGRGIPVDLTLFRGE